MSDENEKVQSKLSRLLKTDRNTYYADTKSKGTEEAADLDIDIDALLDGDATNDEISAKLEKLIGNSSADKDKVTVLRTATGADMTQNTENLKYDDRNPKLDELEQSLINFLERKKDIEHAVPGGIRRIRSLQFDVDVKDVSKPYFMIQIGVCEAVFNAENGLKEKGSCFGIERFVRDWFSLTSVSDVMKKMIEEMKQQTAKKQK